MSALTKPMIHSSRATGAVNPINAEKIISFTEVETTGVPNGSSASFKIVFQMEGGAAPGVVTWNFEDASDMNDDFAAVLVLVSTVTA